MYRSYILCVLIFLLEFDNVRLLSFTKKCDVNEFTCDSNQCIEKSKVCDGTMDCFDWSDELGCKIHCPKPDWFQCKNNHCIRSSLTCDDNDDCGDLSDEEFCESFKFKLEHPSKCTEKEWQCTNHLCIPTDWVCNGQNDCIDNSDEVLGCASNSTCDGFRCQNNFCIRSEWQCDGAADCADSSDELNCEMFQNEKCNASDHFVCADNKTCISMQDVCDKVPHCPDRSDEGPGCYTESRECLKLGCSQQCFNATHGPHCFCHRGYQLANKTYCEDINECEQYGVCDQMCKNLIGSHECSCGEGYRLQNDKKSCKADGGEALMVFSIREEIRGYFLNSQLYFPIAKRLKNAIGVDFDGEYVYWTDILTESASIVKSLENGFGRELLVTSGLGTPEDLAVDWITGNIYFSDAELQHIAVCSNSGLDCAILLTESVHVPRAIVLNPEKGEMYWSDWGKIPEIGKSYMDGTHDISFVSNNIQWPNGLALDLPANRLYWTDAKLHTIETIRLDGTDRRVVLEDIARHPYSIGIFENHLYWSDWTTNSIQSCNKFTGKDHRTIIKQEGKYIYGLRIHHSSLKVSRENTCSAAKCSDLCLLSGTGNSCACAEDRVLMSDNATCEDVESRKFLFIGTKNLIMRMHHQTLGKHEVQALPSLVQEVGALAYNFNNTLYISDTESKTIVQIDVVTGHNSLLVTDTIQNITSLTYDYLGNNLYWCDADRKVVEVLSLSTRYKKILLYDMVDEVPLSVAVIPEQGIMFVAFQRATGAHIDRFTMDGSGRTHVIEHGLSSPVQMVYDFQLDRIFWADAGTGNIESTSSDGDDRHGFRSLQTSLVGLASLGDDMFWTNRNSKRIYWGNKRNYGNGLNKGITLQIPSDNQFLHLVAAVNSRPAYHPCQRNNGNCSHLCLVGVKQVICDCPYGMKLADDRKTCINEQLCQISQFFCKKSLLCVSQEMRCNKRQDCVYGEDEENCSYKTACGSTGFMCNNGKCIHSDLVCNSNYDCEDRSDEVGCFALVEKHFCMEGQFSCNDAKQCVSNTSVCDGKTDCNDGSDEMFCKSILECGNDRFRCLTGKCIPKPWECDEEADCADMSDEHANCSYKACKSSMYKCDNGHCIEKKLLCNNMNDCGDNSDESHCGIDQDTRLCEPNEYYCFRSGNCILQSFHCNGVADCRHNEDEQNCPKCSFDEHQCSNNHCIPMEWICDSKDDCGDGSDEREQLCSFSFNATTCNNSFRCKDGKCVDYKVLCNDVEDCADGSDEHGACSSSCRIHNNPCAQVCTKTPNGPRCACSEGFQLQGNGYSCSDINECSIVPPLCSQRCEEQIGSYRCSCFEGFQLRPDNRSCKSTGEQLEIVYEAASEIRIYIPHTETSQILYSHNIPSVTGLDVDSNSSCIYFSDEKLGQIIRYHLQSGKIEYIINAGNPYLVSVDWITKNIYYYDRGDKKAIRVCDLKKLECAVVTYLNSSSVVTDILTDAFNQYLFHVEVNWWRHDISTSIIRRCDLDGKNVTIVEKSNGGYITSLANDLYKRLLYFTNTNLGHIFSVNYEGFEKTVILRDVYRPVGLDVFEDHLFFFQSNGFIRKCPLYNDYSKCGEVMIDLDSPNSFSLKQTSGQPLKSNTCLKSSCSHICIPKKQGYVCLDKDWELMEELEKTNNTLPYKSDQKEPESYLPSIMEVVFSLLIVCTVIGCIYYKFSYKKPLDNLFIGMRFHNPMYGCEVPEDKLKPGEHEYCNPICQNDGKQS